MNAPKLAVLTVVLAVTVACGSNTATTPSGAGPRVSGLSPSLIVQSQSPQVVTVAGANFLAGLTVSLTDPTGVTSTFEGSAVQSLQASSFQITAVFAVSGSYALQVRDPTGETSDPFTFVAQASGSGSSATPHIDALTPSSATHSATSQVIAIIGTNFSPDLTVTIADPSGQPLSVSIGAVSATNVQVLLVLAQAGTYTVFVTNPSGQVSNAISLSVF
jgi:hypothetical protein